MGKVPLQVINGRFASPILSRGVTKYRKCAASYHLTPQKSVDHCDRFIKHVCSGGFNGASVQLCSDIHQKARKYLQEPGVRHSPSKFASCLKGVQSRTKVCFPYLQNTCANRTVSAVKVIRMHMQVVKEILKLDPTIKVVHLTRDPRGIVGSRKRLKVLANVAHASMVAEGKYLCEKMLTDIQIRKDLQKVYPNNIFPVRYEDYAEDPEEFAQNLYKMLGIPFTESLRHWLTTNTEGKKRRKGLFATQRKNSTVAANLWKTQLKYEIAIGITDVCKELLTAMNYSLDIK